MNVKKILTLFSIIAICLSFAACGNEDAEPDVASDVAATEESSVVLTDESPEETSVETVVTLTESWEFSTGFYPVITSSNSSNYGATYWNRNFYNTLVSYDKSGEIKGELAEDWTISDDGLTYTFTLRDGVKFSGGTLMTADAVKTSFENTIKNLGQWNGSYGKLTSIIASMEVPDDKTFIMTLTQPYYAALNDLTMCNPLAVVNPIAFIGEQDPYKLGMEQTMGTGPYMYDGNFDGTTYTFVRNPHYWGDAPEIDSFKIKVIEDNDAKVLALRGGEIDAVLGASCLSYDAYGELSQDDAYGTAVNDRGAYTRYLGLNLSKAPFDDVNVRRAVAYALDKDVLCEAIFQGIEKPADTLFEDDKPYCDVKQTIYAFDLDKANTLMDEAGWIDSDGDGIREKDGQKLELTMKYIEDLGSLDDGALAIASQLAKIGMGITPIGSDMMTWFNATIEGDYDITICKTYGGAYDPNGVITNMNSDVNADFVAQQVSSVLKGGNALILELDSTPDTSRVQEIYTEILQTNADQAVLIPVSHTREFAAWNSKTIKKYDFYPDSQHISVAGIQIK